MDENSRLADMAEQFTLLRGELNADDAAIATLVLASEAHALVSAIEDLSLQVAELGVEVFKARTED